MPDIKIGVIGGSGLYNMEDLTEVEEIQLSTPFGEPSDSYVVGKLGGQRVAFLPRHGRRHSISPTEVNSHANIWGMKKLGVKYLIGVNASGSRRHGARAVFRRAMSASRSPQKLRLAAGWQKAIGSPFNVTERTRAGPLASAPGSLGGVCRQQADST